MSWGTISGWVTRTCRTNRLGQLGSRLESILSVASRYASRAFIGWGLSVGLFAQPALDLLRCSVLIPEGKHKGPHADHGKGQELSHGE